jgi:hypothetical protein
MTLQQIREALHAVAAAVALGDDEAATALLSRLREDVLRTIADDVDGKLSVSIVRHMAWLALTDPMIVGRR